MSRRQRRLVVRDLLGVLEDLEDHLLVGRHLVGRVLAERREARGQAGMHDHPVLVVEDAVLAGSTLDHLHVAAALERLRRDQVAVGRHARGSIALDHAEQLVAGLIHRPVIGPFEALGVHRVERLELGLVQRQDQPFRIELLARPGVVQVDHVPGAGAAAAQIVHGRRIGDQHLRVDAGAGLLAERIEHRLLGVALPGMDVEILAVVAAGQRLLGLGPELVRIAGAVGGARAPGGQRREKRGRGGRDAGQRRALPQERPAGRGEAPVDVTVHDALLHCSHCLPGRRERWARGVFDLKRYSAANAWQLLSFLSAGRSMVGLVSKKPTGISLKPVVTQGWTGKSSGRGWWCSPNTCQATISAFWIGRCWPT